MERPILDADEYGYAYASRKRRAKRDWAGLSLSDAFKGHLDYYERLPAQRVFYRQLRNVQKRVARELGWQDDGGFEPAAKPQLSPCYTTYPGTLAAHAAIGLTAYLEFQARAKGSLLLAHMKEYLDDPAAADEVSVDPQAYKETAHVVARAVQQRLIFTELQAVCGLPSLEIYRLFCASQQDARFRSLAEIVQAVILFGDVMPPWKQMNPHPTTLMILEDLGLASQSYFHRLPSTQPKDMLRLGQDWVREVSDYLLYYLPAKNPEGVESDNRESPGQNSLTEAGAGAEGLGGRVETMAPLDGPLPPFLGNDDTAGKQIMLALQTHGQLGSGLGGEVVTQGQLNPGLLEVLQDFSKTIQAAGGQHHKWEDMRSDVLEGIIRAMPFQEGPLVGNPTQGREVTLTLGENRIVAGEIFDRPLALSEDMAAVAGLELESEPIAEQLRRNLYPNLRWLPESLRLRTTGVLDSQRLALSGFAGTVFKRFGQMNKADRRGRPVLVIACDGSGSMNRAQMCMLKVLAAAWLQSTQGSEIQVLAGLYHSDQIRPGVGGPLVQWLYHPHKTPALNRGEATRALVSLPPYGTGVQSDALSLAFIMREAQHLARNNMIYLTWLTDTAFNQSFQSELNGQEEVYQLFEGFYKDMGSRLHTLLVALGVENKLELESLLDKVIHVSGKELEDHALVAKRIGLYVADCLRQRRRLLSA